MSYQAMTWATECHPRSPIAKLVLLMLANYADRDGACFPSQKMLARDCSITERAARTHLASLEQGGYLSREHRQRVDGSRASDRIVLSLSIQPEQSSVREQSNRNETSSQPERRSGLTTFEPVTEPATERDKSLSFGRSERQPRSTPEQRDRFWAAYPRRAGSNPKAPALEKFDRAVRNGADPEHIIRGAQRYAAQQRELGKLDTEFVMQATKFLNQRVWEDYATPTTDAVVGRDEAIFRPLLSRYRDEYGADPPIREGGAVFPAEWVQVAREFAQEAM